MINATKIQNKISIIFSYICSHKYSTVCLQISDCKQNFKTKGHLIRHNKKHSSEKPFECNECHKRFKYKDSMNSHKLVHSNEKIFKCDVNDCFRSYNRKSGLQDHKMRFHSGIKRHKCFHNNCDKSFVTSTQLKRHINHKHFTEKNSSKSN